MNKAIAVLLVRVGLGVVGGVALWKLFYTDRPWWFAVIFGAIVVAAAYTSEGWRNRKK